MTAPNMDFTVAGEIIFTILNFSKESRRHKILKDFECVKFLEEKISHAFDGMISDRTNVLLLSVDKKNAVSYIYVYD